jgi:hypothetical protein
MTREVSLAELPEDLQILILQVLESCDIQLMDEHADSMRLPVRTLPINLFPDTPIISSGDDRDLTYAKEMINQKLPPIVICGNQWIDGRHRLWALKKMKVKSVRCIDLQSLIGTYPFPKIATITSEL